MITKRDIDKNLVICGILYGNCMDYCDQERFERLFNVAFNLYKQAESNIVSLIQNPLMPTKTIIAFYRATYVTPNWENLILSELEKRRSDKQALQFLSMTDKEKSQYLDLINKETLFSRIKNFFQRSLRPITQLDIRYTLIWKLYQNCKSFDEKVAFDAFWKTSYFDCDGCLSTVENQEIFDYCISVLEKKYDSRDYSDSLLVHSAKTVHNTFELLTDLQNGFAWILKGLVYCRPYVQPHHVKLLYYTFPPHTFSIEYPVQGLAYFGKTDMECRKLAYEGLEKFICVILRQMTIENMKDWYGDFPRDLYERYTKEYNEQTGENLTY